MLINISQQVQQTDFSINKWAFVQMPQIQSVPLSMKESRPSLRNLRPRALQQNEHLPQLARFPEPNRQWYKAGRVVTFDNQRPMLMPRQGPKPNDLSKSFKLSETNQTNNLVKMGENVSEFQSSLQFSGKGRESITYLPHTYCPYPAQKTYLCSICERVRLVCPYSNSKRTSVWTNKNATMANSVTHGQDHRGSSLTPSSNANCRFCNHNITTNPLPYQQKISTDALSRHRSHSQYLHPASAPPKQPIIKQIVYYPVVHNVLEPNHSFSSMSSSNPEKTGVQTHLSGESSDFKARHQSNSATSPQSSPIKIEEDTILTPAKIREITNSMVV